MPRFERRGFKRFGQNANLPKPIKVGEEYDVEINEVGSKGDGIARIKNFVVFVGNTKKGEKAHIRIKEVRNRFGIGEKISKAKTEEETEEPEEVPEEETEEPEEEPEEIPEEETEEETE
ncbi:MAG: TRAM domain-containing protein [Candidatus Aenigmatarchaeota archaeon]